MQVIYLAIGAEKKESDRVSPAAPLTLVVERN